MLLLLLLLLALSNVDLTGVVVLHRFAQAT
jgi:hypothetical protein